MDLTLEGIKKMVDTIEYYTNRKDYVFYLNEKTWNSFSFEYQSKIKALIEDYHSKLYILNSDALEDGNVYYFPVEKDWYMSGVKKVSPKVVKKQWNPNRRGR